MAWYCVILDVVIIIVTLAHSDISFLGSFFLLFILLLFYILCSGKFTPAACQMGDMRQLAGLHPRSDPAYSAIASVLGPYFASMAL